LGGDSTERADWNGWASSSPVMTTGARDKPPLSTPIPGISPHNRAMKTISCTYHGGRSRRHHRAWRRVLATWRGSRHTRTPTHAPLPPTCFAAFLTLRYLHTPVLRTLLPFFLPLSRGTPLSEEKKKKAEQLRQKNCGLGILPLPPLPGDMWCRQTDRKRGRRRLCIPLPPPTTPTVGFFRKATPFLAIAPRTHINTLYAITSVLVSFLHLAWVSRHLHLISPRNTVPAAVFSACLRTAACLYTCLLSRLPAACLSYHAASHL